jgi:glucose-6-phosphate-specific signal transduction histidine kinase
MCNYNIILLLCLGHLGLQDYKCGYYAGLVSIFDITSGITLILLVLSVLLWLLVIISYKYYCKVCKENFAMICIFVSIFCMMAILGNTTFSFVIVDNVYSNYKAYSTNCTSPAFYSAFVYITIEFLTLAVIILIAIGFFICCCCKLLD